MDFMWHEVPSLKSMLNYIPGSLAIDLSTDLVLYFISQNR